ncbi:MAG TPA: hypothetical protein VGT61_02755 [Thermomicrobiales bacterium]|nr:hypothetical protein [Thermomicrobiales bacterium]
MDLLAVAAVLALVVSGGWWVWGDRAAAPTPPAINGIAGPSTPTGTPTAAYTLPVLDVPWAQPLPDGMVASTHPVSAAGCVTPARDAGSVEAAVAELGPDDGDVSLMVPAEASDFDALPSATEDDRTAATVLFQQLSACRFQSVARDGGTLIPFATPYHALYSTEFLASWVVAWTSGGGQEASPEEQTADLALQLLDLPFFWSYPAEVVDARMLPSGAGGMERMLVRTLGQDDTDEIQTVLLVEEGGGWRFTGSMDTDSNRFNDPRTQIADVRLDPATGEAFPFNGFTSRLEPDRPISLTVANTTDSPRQVSVAVNELVLLEPGQSVTFQPFIVDPAAVEAADGRLRFTIETQTLDGESNGRSYSITVYRSGEVWTGTNATPAAQPTSVSTPVPAATPLGAAANAEMASGESRVVTLDQPWAETPHDPRFGGIAPAPPADCVTPRRASGAVLRIAEVNPTGPVAELPEYLPEAEVLRMTSGLKPGTSDDLIAAQTFLRQWSACSRQVSAADQALEDRHTGPDWSLLSASHIARVLPQGDERSAESRVRQLSWNQVRGPWAQPYPDEVVGVWRWESDERGSPRLLVLHRAFATNALPDVSLLVYEEGVWRLDEFVPSFGFPAGATPEAETSAPLWQLASDVDAFPTLINATGLYAGMPVVIALYNSADRPVSLQVGDQDLGQIAPSSMLVIDPFEVSSEAVRSDPDGFAIPFTFSRAGERRFTVDVVVQDAPATATPIA